MDLVFVTKPSHLHMLQLWMTIANMNAEDEKESVVAYFEVLLL
jgi:hypothetical protein